MGLTVRERILAQWRRNLLVLQDDGSDLFEVVERAPLDRSDFAGQVGCGLIDEGESVAVYLVGFIEMDMVVSVEFWIRVMEGIDPSTELNRVAGAVTKEFLMKPNTVEDTTNAELTLDIKQGILQFDIDGPTDQYISGVRQFIISYRTAKQDPYELR